MGKLYRRDSGKYYGDYVDHLGNRVRRSTNTSNKQDAAKILAKWESDANSMRHGIAVPSSTTIEHLLAEYLEYLGNSSPKHIELTERRLRAVIDANGWIHATEINQYQVETAVRQLEFSKSPKKPPKRLALRTQSHYLGAFKSFTKWLVAVRGALIRDPLVAVRKPNFQSDRRLIRRFLLPEEWQWLAQTPNALLYETAIQTGFRSNEINQICPQHLGKHFIYLPASATKNKQEAKQYITESLYEKLSQPNALPFAVPDEERLAELLRADLATARKLAGNQPIGFLEPKNALGHTLDFHALRHTCGAWLALAGVSPKVIQSVMRHSSISLTLDTYGHLLPGAEQDAIQKFATVLSACAVIVPKVRHFVTYSGHLPRHMPLPLC